MQNTSRVVIKQVKKGKGTEAMGNAWKQHDASHDDCWKENSVIAGIVQKRREVIAHDSIRSTEMTIQSGEKLGLRKAMLIPFLQAEANVREYWVEIITWYTSVLLH